MGHLLGGLFASTPTCAERYAAPARTLANCIGSASPGRGHDRLRIRRIVFDLRGAAAPSIDHCSGHFLLRVIRAVALQHFAFHHFVDQHRSNLIIVGSYVGRQAPQFGSQDVDDGIGFSVVDSAQHPVAVQPHFGHRLSTGGRRLQERGELARDDGIVAGLVPGMTAYWDARTLATCG